jgi:hypothetical protein
MAWSHFEKRLGVTTKMVEVISGELELLSGVNREIIKKHFYQHPHFERIFPKSCNTCGQGFINRLDYLSKTLALANGGTLIDKNGVQEFRNCGCGSTLLVLVPDSRDHSSLGLQRRQLFERCVKKIQENHSVKDAEQQVREIFRWTIQLHYGLYDL